MRQKRIFMVLAMIVASLALTIAYASITSQVLNISGSSTTVTSDANFDVNLKSYAISGDGTTTATINSDKKAAEISVSNLTTEGQKAIVAFTVANESAGDLDAWPFISVTNSNPTWYKVGYYGDSLWYGDGMRVSNNL